MTDSGLDLAALGFDLDEVARHVDRYVWAREAARARLSACGAGHLAVDLDVQARALPTRGAVALARLVARAELPAIAEAARIAADSSRWPGLSSILDDVHRCLWATEGRHPVVVSPRLAGHCRDLLIVALRARYRQDGALRIAADMNHLLRELDALARARPDAFAAETVAVPAETLDVSTTEVTTAEYARRAGCSVQWARHLARTGRVPAHQVGPLWLLHTDLEAAADDDDGGGSRSP